QVLATGQLVIDGRVLAGEADRAAYPVRIAEQVVAGDGGRARVWPHQRGQNPDHGRLAGAIRSEKGEDGAGLDGKIDVIESVVPAEGLGDRRGINCVWHTLNCMRRTQLTSSLLVQHRKEHADDGAGTAAAAAGP